MDYFKNLSSCGFKPAIISLIPSYNHTYVRKKNNKLPKPLTGLDRCNEECVNDSLDELLRGSTDSFNSLKISSEEAQLKLIQEYSQLGKHDLSNVQGG